MGAGRHKRGLGGARGGQEVQEGARRCKRGPGHANGAQDVKVRAGMCGRRVWHIGGAQDVQMGAEMHKRGPVHAKGGWEARCIGGRGQGCVGTGGGMGPMRDETLADVIWSAMIDEGNDCNENRLWEERVRVYMDWRMKYQWTLRA